MDTDRQELKCFDCGGTNVTKYSASWEPGSSLICWDCTPQAQPGKRKSAHTLRFPDTTTAPMTIAALEAVRRDDASRITELEAEVERLRKENLELRAADRELVGYQRGIEDACNLLEELKTLARTPGQDPKRREWWDGAYWWVLTALTHVRALSK